MVHWRKANGNITLYTMHTAIKISTWYLRETSAVESWKQTHKKSLRRYLRGCWRIFQEYRVKTIQNAFYSEIQLLFVWITKAFCSQWYDKITRQLACKYGCCPFTIMKSSILIPQLQNELLNWERRLMKWLGNQFGYYFVVCTGFAQ